MKNLKPLALLILFPLFFPSLLSANDGYDYYVYVWGDAESVKNAFQSVALFIGDSDFMNNVKYIAALVSMLYVGRHFVEENYKKALMEVAYILAILGFIYGSTSNVKILDKRANIAHGTSAYYTVDNIPFLLAFTAHTASIFTEFMVNEINDVSPALDSQTYAKMGFIKNLEFLKKQLLMPNRLSKSNENYKVVSNYYSVCIMKNALDISPDKFLDIANPNGKIKDYIKPSNLGIESKKYNDSYSCKDYYDKAKVNGTDTGVEKALDNVGQLLTTLDKNATSVDLTNTSSDFLKITDIDNKLGSVDSVNNILAASKAYATTAVNAGIGVPGIDTTNRVSSEASKLQLIQNGTGQFAWMADMLPKSMHILTIIILMAYMPMGVIAAFMGMEKGLMLISKFFFGYIAYQSMHIALAITQNVTNWYMHTNAVGELYFLAQHGTIESTINIPSYVQYLSDMTGLAGVIGVVSVPVVVGIMYKGEVAAASGAAMGVSGMFKSLGVKGAMSTVNENFEQNKALEQYNNASDDELIARKRLERMGVTIPTSGSAVQALQDIESGMDRANRSAASADAMTTEGGEKALLAGGHVKATMEEQNKLGFGQRVVVDGGEINALQDAKAVGQFSGNREAASLVQEGETLQKIAGDDHRSVQTLGAAAGTVDGMEKGASEAHRGIAAINSGLTDNNGNSVSAQMKHAKELSEESNSIKSQMAKIGDKSELQDLKKSQENSVDEAEKSLQRITNEEYDPLHPKTKKEQQELKEKHAEALKKLDSAKADLSKTNEKLSDLSRLSLQESAVNGDLLAINKSNPMEKQKARLSAANNFETATGLSAEKAIVGAVAVGAELNSGNASQNFANALKATKLKAIQDTQTEMETGNIGNEDSFRTVAKQNAHIAAQAINNTDKRRKELNSGTDKNGKHTEAWNADKVAEGQAISAVQNEIKQQGAFNALQKENSSKKSGGDDSAAFRRAAMGSEFSGRKEENDMLGVGKKWAEKTATGDDIKLMAKEQDNAAVGAIGGIEATHAEIMKHGGVDGAIRDMVTQAQKKGIESAASSKNLRTEYGSNLNKESDLLKKDKEKVADEKIKKAQNNIDSMKKLGISGRPLEEQEKDLDDAKEEKAKIQASKGMTLADVSQTIDKSKLESAIGQAAGIKENLKKDVSYAQNAMYGEESKQQSTKAKIDTQGGVDKAVTADVNEASLKAAKQQQGTQSEIEQQIASNLAKSNPDASPEAISKSAHKLAESIMSGGDAMSQKLSSVLEKGIKAPANLANGTVGDMSNIAVASAGTLAGTMMGAKTASDIRGVANAGSSEKYIQASGDLATKKSEEMLAGSSAMRKSGMLGENGKLTQEGKLALDKDQFLNTGEVMRGAELYSDKKYIKSRMADVIDNAQGKEEKEKTAQQMKEFGIVKDDIKFNKDGSVNRDSIHLGSQEDVMTGLGKAQGNKLTDKMKSLVFGGTQSKINGNATSSVYDKTSAHNSGKSNKFGDTSTSDSGMIMAEKMVDSAAKTAGKTLTQDERFEAAKNLKSNTDLIDYMASKKGIITEAQGAQLKTLAAKDAVTGSHSFMDKIQSLRKDSTGNTANDEGWGIFETAATTGGIVTLKAIDSVSKVFNPNEIPAKATPEQLKGTTVDSSGNFIKKGELQPDGSFSDDVKVANKDGILLDKDGDIKMKPNPEKNTGVVTKGIKKTWGGLKSGAGYAKDSLIEKLTPTSSPSGSEPSDSTTNSGNPDDTKKYGDGTSKNSETHSNSLSKDTNSITKSGETSKSAVAKISKLVEHGKGLSEGLILGQIMEDAPVESFNQTGPNRLSNAQEFANNTLGGVTNIGLSALASTGNWLDKVNPFGNPFNSLAKKEFGEGLSPIATQLLSSGMQEFSNAGSNLYGVTTGSHEVAGIMNRVGNHGQAGETIVAPPAVDNIPQHAKTAFAQQADIDTAGTAQTPTTPQEAAARSIETHILHQAQNSALPTQTPITMQASLDTSSISSSLANSLSSITVPTGGVNMVPSSNNGVNHIQTGGGSSFENTIGVSSSSMGGGHIGSVLSEQKSFAEAASSASRKVSTEHATNDYMQGADILDTLREMNQNLGENDRNMNNGS